MPTIKELFQTDANDEKFAPSYPTRYWRSLPNTSSPVTYRLNTIFDENDMKWSYDSNKSIDFTASSLIYGIGHCGGYVATALGNEALMAMNGIVTEQIINARRKNVFVHKQNGEFVCELAVCEENDPPVYSLGWTVCGKLVVILQNGRLKLFDLRDTRCSYEEVTIFTERATELAKKARDEIIEQERIAEERKRQEELIANGGGQEQIPGQQDLNDETQQQQNGAATADKNDGWEIVIKDGVKKRRRKRTYADDVRESIQKQEEEKGNQQQSKLKGLLESVKRRDAEERRKKREELRKKKQQKKIEEENRCILSHVKFYSVCGNAFSCVCRHLESGIIALVSAPLGSMGTLERGSINIRLINPTVNPVYNHIIAPASSRKNSDQDAITTMFANASTDTGIIFGSTSIVNATNRTIVDIDVIRANVFPAAGTLTNPNTTGGDVFQSHASSGSGPMNLMMKDAKRVTNETLRMMKLTNLPVTPDTLLSIVMLTNDGQLITVTQPPNEQIPMVRAELFFNHQENTTQNYTNYTLNSNLNASLDEERDARDAKFSGVLPCCNEAARISVDDVTRRFLAVYWPVGDSYNMIGGTRLYSDFYSGMKKEYSKQNEKVQEAESTEKKLGDSNTNPSTGKQDNDQQQKKDSVEEETENSTVTSNREIVMKMLMKELSTYGLTRNETFALQRIVGVVRVYSFTFTNPFIDASQSISQQNQFLSEHFIFTEHEEYPYNYLSPKPTGKNGFFGWVSDVSPCISLVLKAKDELVQVAEPETNEFGLTVTQDAGSAPSTGASQIKKKDDFLSLGVSALSSLYQSTKCTGVLLFGPQKSTTFYHLMYGSDVSLFCNEVDGFRIFNKYGSNLLMQVPIPIVEMFSPYRARSIYSHVFEAYSANEVGSFVADKLFRQLIDRTASGGMGISAANKELASAENSLSAVDSKARLNINKASKDLTVVSQFDSTSSNSKSLAELLMEIIDAISYESDPMWSKLMLACVSYSKMFTNEGRICCNELSISDYSTNSQLKSFQLDSFNAAVQVSNSSTNVNDSGMNDDDSNNSGGGSSQMFGKAVPWLSRSYLPYFYASLFGTSLVLTSPLKQTRIYPRGSTRITHYESQINSNAWVLPSTAYVNTNEIVEMPPSSLLTDSYLLALRLQRICNALRASGLACTASEIKSEGIIPTLSKLLAINDHATCFVISQLLRISPRTVLLDWATRLIISNPMISDVEIAFNIFRRFRNFNIGYHEIVPAAIEVQRATLANLLMHSEVDLQTRMHFYIQIGDFKQAIFTALESNDTELALTTMMVASENEEGMRQLVQLVTVDPRVMRLFLHKNRVARSGLIYQIAEASKPKNYTLMAEAEWRNAHVQKSAKRALVNLESARICGMKADKRMDEAVGMVKSGIDMEKMSKFFSSLSNKIKKGFSQIKSAFTFKKGADEEEEAGTTVAETNPNEPAAPPKKSTEEMLAEDVNTDEITDEEELARVREIRQKAKEKERQLKDAAKQALEASIAANAAAASFGITDSAGVFRLTDIAKFEASLLKIQREISATMSFDICGFTVFDTLVFVLRRGEENFAKKLREKLKISNKLWMAANMYVFSTAGSSEHMDTTKQELTNPEDDTTTRVRFSSSKMVDFMKKMKKDADYRFGFCAAKFAGDYTTANAFNKNIPDPKERFKNYISIHNKEAYVTIAMSELTIDDLYEMMSEYNGSESILQLLKKFIIEKEKLQQKRGG